MSPFKKKFFLLIVEQMLIKGHIQDGNVDDLGVICMGFISLIHMPNMKSLFFMVQKL